MPFLCVLFLDSFHDTLDKRKGKKNARQEIAHDGPFTGMKLTMAYLANPSLATTTLLKTWPCHPMVNLCFRLPGTRLFACGILILVPPLVALLDIPRMFFQLLFQLTIAKLSLLLVISPSSCGTPCKFHWILCDYKHDSSCMYRGECKYNLTEDGHADWVSCVRLSPNPANPVIVSCGWDKLVKVRNPLEKELGMASIVMNNLNICYFRSQSGLMRPNYTF